MGGDDGSASYYQTERWNQINYAQSQKSSALQQQSLCLQKQSMDISQQGLSLQKESMELTKESNAMQKESLSVAKEQAATAKESLAVSKEQAQIAKQSQKLQQASLIEPEKKVDSAKDASDATARAQALRSGLGSTFSRSGFGYSATSGTSKKLGG